VRGLPTTPPAPILERTRALPYFINNVAPGVRAGWIRISKRRKVIEAMRDDLPRLAPGEEFAPPAGKADARLLEPLAVALFRGILLGSIESPPPSGKFTLEELNPAPQTIRPDMTHRVATQLLQDRPYLLVTDARGVYLGRYDPARRMN
jgi:hypothetical protein